MVTVIGQNFRTGDSKVRKLTSPLYDAYIKLQKATQADGHDMRLNSGFRSYAEQEDAYNSYKNGTGALAAKPGRSNHQNGIAIDINTGGFNTKLYKWMKKNAPDYGFVRTVSSEHWHWEYRPSDAKNGYKLKGVAG